MKNSHLYIALVLSSVLSITSCKKDTKTVQRVDPKSGKVTNVEVPIGTENSTSTTVAKPAIVDSAGVFYQSFKLTPGKKYPFTTVQKETKTMTGPDGKSQSISVESVDEMDFEVKSFQNGIYDIQVNLLAKKTSQTANGKTEAVDTKESAPTEKQKKAIYTMNKALVGNSLSLKMKETGDILSITGFESIQGKINSALGQITKNAQEKKMMTEGLKQSFNANVLKEQISKNLKLFPKKGLKIGEKLEKVENLNQDGSMKITTQYRLMGVDNGIAKFSISGGMPKVSKSQTKAPLTQTISAEITQSGEITYDTQTGWLKNQNIKVVSKESQSITDGKQTQSAKSVSSNVIIVNP